MIPNCTKKDPGKEANHLKLMIGGNYIGRFDIDQVVDDFGTTDLEDSADSSGSTSVNRTVESIDSAGHYFIVHSEVCNNCLIFCAVLIAKYFKA